MLVTGGSRTLTTVSRYGKQGWLEDFSYGLKTGRAVHGCGSYIAVDNERVYIHVIPNEQSIIIMVAGVAGHWGPYRSGGPRLD